MSKKIINTTLERLPKSVRILHSTYSLNLDDGHKLTKNNRLGEIDFHDREINYLDLESSDTADTIIHELLHGLWYAFDLGEEELEEHIVKALATGITTIMKDNPELFGVLQDIVDGDELEPDSDWIEPNSSLTNH